MYGASQEEVSLTSDEDRESENNSAGVQEKAREKRPHRIIKPTIKVLESGNKAVNPLPNGKLRNENVLLNECT